MIEFKCSECRAPLEIEDDQAGNKIACPKCGKITSIPGSDSPPIAVVCNNCGAELDASPLQGGQLINCSSCGGMVLVPSMGKDGPVGGCMGLVALLGLVFVVGMAYVIL